MKRSTHNPASGNAASRGEAGVAEALAALEAGRNEDAERFAAAVLARRKDDVNALHLRALAVKRQGRLDEAEAFLRQALRFAPGEVALQNNLGNTLREAGKLDEAEAALREALRLAPEYVEAWNNLGNVSKDRGDFPAAAEQYQRALAIRPDYADALNNLGGALQKLGRLAEAVDNYRRALTARPSFAMAHYNLANALTDTGVLDEAIAHFREALRLQPDYVEALNGLLRQLQTTCQWDEVPALSARLREMGARSGKVFPFSFLAIDSDEAEQQQCARRWAEVQYASLRRLAQSAPFVHARPAGQRRLRLGYLSSDFHDHATAWLMAEVFELHDRTQFEVHAFSLGPDDGRSMRKRLMAAFEHFHDLRGRSWPDIARLIHTLGIDVLVDLKGYTKDTGSPVLALRPAPVQVNYLGYPGTLGNGMADYILTDRIVTPPGHAACYDEAFAYLPVTYQCNDRKREIGARPERKRCGLPEEAVVFACFNHTYKITSEMFDLWCAILTDVQGSVLWLLKSNAWAEMRLRDEAARRGVARDRIVFAENQPLREHLGRLQNADVFLDTRPYNAHTTCSDALWAGVPVVTWPGQTFASRVASSLLAAVGLESLAAADGPRYRALAVQLAREPQTRERLRRHLVEQRDRLPLFDSPRLTRAMESLYRAMWARWCAGLPPAAMQYGPAQSGGAR
ncbi:tetratricopeptide repeat protein [Niveibacterium umoris]|uniref:protein O-GlcNAc transferase n=1 Tax=Niveibacterium umoris TaxID=1193620 RepID=A0A840BM10_9RHOO|nr:putative O-linked N-acetylglucosamine transferase (SPINDLY family) [Niveibacterium umoris]